MKFIKLFVISAVVLMLLLTAFSSLLPSKIRISRAINIMDSPADISEKIRNMKDWEQWNEYAKALKIKNVTDDSIHSDILSISVISVDSTSIKTSWRQKDRMSFPGIFNLVLNNSQTTVQWYFDFSIKWYPWEKFGSIIYDKQLGPQMEKSLQNLKQMLEKAP